MNRNPIWTLLAGLALAQTAHASTGAAWLDYPGSARNVAEAGGLGVMADGVQALGLNPAGLASATMQGEAQVSHSSWAADIKAEHLSSSFRVGGMRAAVGASWVDFGSIQGYRYDAQLGNVPDGELRPSAGAFGFSLASSVTRRLELGATAQWLMQDLSGGGRSNAPALDLGARASLPWGLRAGVSLVHLGGTLDGSALPSAARFGLAMRPLGSRWEAGVEGHRLLGSDTMDAAGALRLHLGSALVARAGWLGMAGQAMLPSFGASFNVGAWTLDYAYRGSESLGATHHLGVQFFW